MAYRDLQEYIRRLERIGQLKRVATEVDPELEITEIADRVVKAAGPALLFERVKGSEYPVLINAFGSMERMAMALGVECLDDIGAEIAEYFEISQYIGLINQVKAVPRLTRLAGVFPKKLNGRGACQDVVEKEPDLSALPVLKCWPGDAGRFFTLPLVFTRDPETGTQNCGMYRLQVYDKTTTGMHWHLHKDGRAIYEKYKALGGRMPVSVALGCDPAITYAATAPLPSIIDEMLFAGFLRKAPVPMVKSVTNEVWVPADAEFVLEGYVDANEPLRCEGPFGDHTGYYSLADDYPVFHVECITHKASPVFPATVVGKPPMEDCFLGKATERIFLPLLKLQLPEIVDICFPLEGVFHNCVIVSIQKRFPGHARKVMNALWGMGQMMYTKMVVVVDGDVSPQDISTVAWKVFNNIDARRDLVISEGPLDALDHASSLPHYGSRLGIDATKKWKEEGHLRDWPDDIRMTDGVKALVDGKWASYGI